MIPTISSGRHCLQTVCDLNPCQNGGRCQLTPDSHRCSCPQGFGGVSCQSHLRPCQQRPDPCSGHGICIEKGDPLSEAAEEARKRSRRRRIRLYGASGSVAEEVTESAVKWLEGGYRCQCHLWWTGEKPSAHILFPSLAKFSVLKLHT